MKSEEKKKRRKEEKKNWPVKMRCAARVEEGLFPVTLLVFDVTGARPRSRPLLLSAFRLFPTNLDCPALQPANQPGIRH